MVIASAWFKCIVCYRHARYEWLMLDPRLRYLEVVARSASFTAAAHSAGVTQSTITRSIADLEREIGYAIFYRTSRGVILTERGGDFVTRVSRLLEDTRELITGGMGNDPHNGLLRIGVCPASLEWWLIEVLGELISKHPGIRFDISSASFETIVQHLRSGAIDIAVGFDAAFREWSDVRREPMGSLKSRLFVRQGHPLLELDTVTEHDLASYDIVSPSDSRPFGEIIRNLYESAGIDWRDRMHHADFFPAVRRIVERSNAIGVVALSHARSSQFLDRFILVPDVDPFPVLPLCCALRVRWQPKAVTRAFIKIAKRNVAEPM
jgi:DNA-binding transcriptional LysR family regulator